MTYTDTIKVKVKSEGFSNITGKVESIVRKSKIKNGICVMFSVGATSGLLINEDDPMLLEDLKNSLEKIAGKYQIYHHTENARSHIRSSLIGNSQNVPVKNGKMLLGTWQEIMVANFDTGEREREVVVSVIGE
ncbi:MAG: secondary thiamine-phosphate synthase enzyme YjbQ [Candidatus Aenigmatarchaeota archaeon]